MKFDISSSQKLQQNQALPQTWIEFDFGSRPFDFLSDISKNVYNALLYSIITAWLGYRRNESKQLCTEYINSLLYKHQFKRNNGMNAWLTYWQLFNIFIIIENWNENNHTKF